MARRSRVSGFLHATLHYAEIEMKQNHGARYQGARKLSEWLESAWGSAGYLGEIVAQMEFSA